MQRHSEGFVAFEVAKTKTAVAIAEGVRGGEARFLGEIENSAEATRPLVVTRQTQSAADVLLRGRPDRLWALPLDHRSWP